jgi:hypothetical protein
MFTAEFDPQSAREFTRLFYAYYLATQGTNLRRKWKEERGGGRVYLWSEKEVFIPTRGFSEPSKYLEGTGQFKLGLGWPVLPENYSMAKCRIDALIEGPFPKVFAHGQMRYEGRIVPAFGEASGSHTGAPYCPYQHNLQYERCEKAISKISGRLSRGTEFQKWLRVSSGYHGALEKLHKKPMIVFPDHNADSLRIGKLHTGTVEWAFQYTLARALLAFHCYQDFPTRVERAYPNKVSDTLIYNDRIKGLAEKLSIELEAIPGEGLDYVIKHLDRIVSSRASKKRRKPRVSELSISRRRSLYVRELSLVGQSCLHNQRSRTGRFPSDVVSLSCQLIGHAQVADRSVIEQQQKLSDSDIPLTPVDGGRPLRPNSSINLA